MELRMLDLNKVVLVGRLTRDPELRFTQTNQGVTSFDIAVNRSFKDTKTGEWREITSYVTIVVWGKLAEICAQKAKKGFPVFVEGRLQSRSWESKTGEKRSKLEVVADRVQVLIKSSSVNSQSAQNIQATKVEDSKEFVSTNVPNNSSSDAGDITDEEIPF